jgi:integrase
MSIYRNRDKQGKEYGGWILERTLLPRRNIKIFTGKTEKGTVKKMDSMVDDLRSSGRDDILQSILDDPYPSEKFKQYFVVYLKGQLLNPHTNLETVKPLREPLETWMKTWKGWNDKTRKDMTEKMNVMFRLVGKDFPNPTIEDIPALLRQYKSICDQKDTPYIFRHVKSCFQRFVREKYGKSSDIFQKISDVEVLPIYKTSSNPSLSAKTPEQIDRLTKVLPPEYRQMVWTMCTLGVGWKEYQSYVVRDDIKTKRVIIEGTKMDRKDKRRRREVPYILPPHPPTCSEKWFYKILKRYGKKVRMDVTVYSFRHSYSLWLRESGVPDWRVSMYMGHQPKTQTQSYQRSEVWKWLLEDGEKVRRYIDERLSKAKKK